MSILTGLASLFADVNKAKDGLEQSEGVMAPLLPELNLQMEDSELIDLKRRYENSWQTIAPEIEAIRKRNQQYWEGKQPFDPSYYEDQTPIADNLIFESLETFLPIATRKNPEPVVTAGEGDEAKALADTVRKALIYLADSLQLKLILKDGVRHWALFRLGAWKLGYSMKDEEINVDVVRPQKLILDPYGTFDRSGYFNGEFIGEYKEDMASTLIRRFPKKAEYIKSLVVGEMGSRIKYIEWWSDDYVFWTLNNEVLAKYKNPHWNYEGEEEITNEFGEKLKRKKAGSNHFAYPRKPYIGLTIFTLGLKPFDDTSLIEQNISLQDMVQKRLMQIDRNADNTNAGNRISGDHFTQEEAARADKALRKGKSVWIPRGSVEAAIKRDQASALPGFVYESLVDYRNELRNIFGVRGSTAQGIANQETVRGKILSKTADDSRIGGGITEYIEQIADGIFNYMVQLMYVYYTNEHFVSIVGDGGSVSVQKLTSKQLEGQKLLVSVKEGSLIPDDPLTRRNEAIDLWGAGALDPVSLFKRLGDPNPAESAKALVMWKSNPMGLFPEVQQPGQIPPMDEQAMQSQDVMQQVPLQ